MEDGKSATQHNMATEEFLASIRSHAIKGEISNTRKGAYALVHCPVCGNTEEFLATDKNKEWAKSRALGKMDVHIRRDHEERPNEDTPEVGAV